MNLTIAQDHQYAGNDYWKWRAWIDGEPADLDKIEMVRWFLHPSFARSVVESRVRSTGFRLETSGWGTFTLRAEAHCLDGTVQTLHQPLKLFYPDEAAATKARSGTPSTSGAIVVDAENVTGKTVEKGVRKVFLSFASGDRRGALVVRRALEAHGLTVVDDSAISAEQPLELATLNLLTDADATVAYISSDLPSAFVAQYINASLKSGKPTLVVTGEQLGPIAGVPSEVPVLELDLKDDSAIAAALARLVGAG
jgi:YEATS family